MSFNSVCNHYSALSHYFFFITRNNYRPNWTLLSLISTINYHFGLLLLLLLLLLFLLVIVILLVIVSISASVFVIVIVIAKQSVAFLDFRVKGFIGSLWYRFGGQAPFWSQVNKSNVKKKKKERKRS